jgi:hypothetical protein
MGPTIPQANIVLSAPVVVVACKAQRLAMGYTDDNILCGKMEIAIPDVDILAELRITTMVDSWSQLSIIDDCTPCFRLLFPWHGNTS